MGRGTNLTTLPGRGRNEEETKLHATIDHETYQNLTAHVYHEVSSPTALLVHHGMASGT